MDENEIDRASHRSNMIEQRMFEITIASIETLKHSAAIELHKSQNEMKKRLRRYRERQREIVRSDPNYNNKDSIDDFITRQMKNKAKARQSTRPKTSLGISSTNTSMVSPQSARARSVFQQDDDSESDVEIDGTFMIDQQKSKIDLRPKTAIDIVRRGISLATYVDTGRLGPQGRQVRYFDDDELKDRGFFYRHLVQKRITEEKNKLNNLDDKVAQFCGNETIQTITKKSLAKRKYFSPNNDWDNNSTTKPTEKTPLVVQKKDIKSTKQEKHSFKHTVRPSTSVGIRHVSSFDGYKSPIHICTPR